MNKSKQKRIKKDLDKLFSQGAYLDWLNLLYETGVSHKYAKEEKHAWDKVINKAVQSKTSIVAIFDVLEKAKPNLDLPDFKFLSLLKEFINAGSGLNELMSITGISVPLQNIQKKLAVTNLDDNQTKKIKKLLNSFVKKPDKITKKYFTDLSSLLGNTEISKQISYLSQYISEVRKLNPQLKPKANFFRLSSMDEFLKDIYEKMTENIRKIVFYPFVYNVSIFLKNLSVSKANANEVADSISSIPFLFTLIAGETSDDIKIKLLDFNADMVDYKLIEQKISKATFEEKIVLIRKVRQLVKSEYEHDYEDDDYDEFKEQYSDLLIKLYKGVLAHIKVKQHNLSAKEKRELPKVLGEAVLLDLPTLWEEPEDLLDMLTLVAQSGCLNAKLSILSLIVAKDLDNRKLMTLAKNALDTSSKPNDEDFKWLFRHFSFIYFPILSNLSPLIDLYSYDEKFNNLVYNMLQGEVEMLLTFNTMSRDKHDGLIGLIISKTMKNVNNHYSIIIKELERFPDYKPFSEISTHIKYFSDGCLTYEGYESLYKYIYEKKGLGPVIENAVEPKVTHPILNELKGILDAFDLSVLKRKAAIALLENHLDELENASISLMENVYTLISSEKAKQATVIKINNILQKQCEKSGKDERLEDLKLKIYNLLYKMKKTTKTTKTSKKSKKAKK